MTACSLAAMALFEKVMNRETGRTRDPEQERKTKETRKNFLNPRSPRAHPASRACPDPPPSVYIYPHPFPGVGPKSRKDLMYITRYPASRAERRPPARRTIANHKAEFTLCLLVFENRLDTGKSHYLIKSCAALRNG
jgi:hypothetical protein